MRINQLSAVVAGTLVLASVLGASASGSSQGSAATTSSRIATQSQETWKIGTGVGAPPFEFYKGDTKTIRGFEPDLLRVIAKRLNAKLDWQVTNFESLFSGLDSQRYDFLAYGLADRKSRQVKYDLLDYALNAGGFLGKAGARPVKTWRDVCGRSVAILAGSTGEAFLQEASKSKCTSKGLDAIRVLSIRDQAGVVQAVRTDRTELASGDIPLLAYEAKQVSGLKVYPFSYLRYYVAMVFPKNSALMPKIRKALNGLMADGTYSKIMGKWNLKSAQLKRTYVNAGTNE